MRLTQQQIDERCGAGKRSQRASQFPVARAQTPQQHERQQQCQADERAQQRSLQAAPATEHGIGGNAGQQPRNG